MDFQTSVKKCFRDYSTFSGRAPRSEFWWFVLFTTLGGIAAAAIDTALFGLPQTGPFNVIFSLAVLIPYLAVSVRRLHDINRSGWWLLIALIPLIGFIILLIWFIRRSNEGTNRYGENPLALPGPE